MSDRAEFERQFPSRNKWLGNRYDHPMDQARWEAWCAARRWMPIESAPKDGTAVILTDGCNQAVARYMPELFPDADDGAKWAIDDWHNEPRHLRGGYRATHWQPRSEPPHD